MTTYIDTKIVSLTSQSATIKYNGSYLSNVKYNLGTIIRSDANIIHRQVQLLNAQIPVSFYTINYTNNLFRFTTVAIAPTILTVTVPPGNYNANNLITTLKGLIDTAIGDTSSLLTINSITGKMTFGYQFEWTIYNNFTYSIGNVLGLQPNSVNVGIPLDMSIVTATYPLNLLGIKTLQVRSTNLIMDNISSVQGGQTTLLNTIPVSAVPFGMIDYHDVGNNLMTIYNESLDDIDIDIVDGESGELINFNNQDWCITLAFHLTISIPQKQSDGLTKSFNQIPKIEPIVSNPLEKTNPNLNTLNILTS